ncbi:hypothetical protein RD110_24715 [Rhodoferax koreense]|uniref:Lipocalin-like domain-containing protein n=1 Tax=Rhodoferax koreensis TaxID=1842727 RepID=A0A1P8K1Y1_9BURK|nr:hypothetical protein [Rhodoferax koreense]APW40010.1 hypothetical protein RD110_24715 [Rhodoferax koreense]
MTEIRLRLAIPLLAACLGAGAAAQGVPAACPAPADIVPQHLYGTWLAQVDGEAGPVTIRLGRHPELAGSVSGTLERKGPAGAERAQVAGDVDEGDFTLEESSDGQRIGATWIGRMTDASCGKEIKGTWTKASDTSSNAARSFTLRKQGGWQ